MTEESSKRMVEVRPLPLEKWHGKKGDSSVAAARIIQAMPDNTSIYQIAMSEKKLADYAKKLNQDLSLQFILGEIHPFWDSKVAQIKLENKTSFYDLDNPIEDIKVSIMKSPKCRDVANSLKEWEDGFYPEATHYIVDEEEEVEIFAQKEVRRKVLYKKIEEATREDKEDIVFLMTGKKFSKNQANSFIDFEINKLFTKRFDELYSYVISSNKEDIKIQALLEKAVKAQFIVKDGFKYMYEGTNIGNSETEVLEFLQEPDNQIFKLDLIEKVEAL